MFMPEGKSVGETVATITPYVPVGVWYAIQNPDDAPGDLWWVQYCGVVHLEGDKPIVIMVNEDGTRLEGLNGAMTVSEWNTEWAPTVQFVSVISQVELRSKTGDLGEG